MIDLQNEPPISLAAAARALPPGRNGRPVSLSCIFRWIVDGVLAPDGKRRVRLEASRVGGRWLTSIAALERFADRQTPTFEDSAPIRSANKTRTASERAGAALEKLGI